MYVNDLYLYIVHVCYRKTKRKNERGATWRFLVEWFKGTVKKLCCNQMHKI